MNQIAEPLTSGTTKSPIPTYMTVQQYAEYRQASRTTVFNWINLGLPSVKMGRLRRIRVDVADAWLDAGNVSFARPVARKRVGGSQ
jgi:excisionase family DNA binding protein